MKTVQQDEEALKLKRTREHIAQKKYRDANVGKERARKILYYATNPEKREEERRNKRAAYLANRTFFLAKQKAYRIANPEKARAVVNAWAAKNPHKKALLTASRRAPSRQATPRWRNKFYIEEIYDLARRRTKATGILWHVDHIIPLNHPDVCGLHNEFNLQVIPAVKNLAKKNRFDRDGYPDRLAYYERAKEVLA